MMTGWAIDDSARLRTVTELGIGGDSPPDPALDAIVAEAAAMSGMPIALVTAVGAEQQWFKARVGTDLTGTPVDMAICAHVLAKGDALVIPDLAADARTIANPLVTDAPNIRFYAGVPLVTDGQAVGTLCVLDTEPHEGFGPDKMGGLSKLADMAMDALRRMGAAAQA
ncbi:GAF domain-containing protein [Sphingomonas donggukensis]|uniref:GAF domain-containing protein n=1 Tax=Sphingomonas donggukensis TaxID=2949093 RepID=A0ABY4TSL8_9SPHN|nr:GAF domain-containing protein [Sphingomonas donggukensis]URW75407.1 GAF domain-containing protein [Sphingomonas donggukensis]